MTVDDLLTELAKLPPSAVVFVVEADKRNAVPLDIVDVTYAAGHVTIGVDVEIYRK